MVRILLLGYFLFQFFEVQCQDFPSVGTKWYYTEQFAFSYRIDYFSIEAEKDTLFQGQNCIKLVKRHVPFCSRQGLQEFVYNRNDSVFYWSFDLNRFEILYDFNAVAGDSWLNTITDEYGDPDTLTITVDSISQISINGNMLKVQFVTYHMMEENRTYSIPSEIIEGIGDIRYLFNWSHWSEGSCDGNRPIGIRCFQDSSLGFYQFPNQSTCDYTNLSTEEIDLKEIQAYPNPLKNKLFLSKIAPELSYDLCLYDLRGNQLWSGKFLTHQKYIDTEDWPHGALILNIQSAGQSNQVLLFK